MKTMLKAKMWLFWNNVYLKVSSCGKLSLKNRGSEKVAYSKSSSPTVLFVTKRLSELSIGCDFEQINT